mmetsp:Transcript_14684/g.29229  ORF Transcript_14684/g.29229 Transcript_14684/m.29229 type:complete len:253 (+) Transcript_14684:382-1140(+)
MTSCCSLTSLSSLSSSLLASESPILLPAASPTSLLAWRSSFSRLAARLPACSISSTMSAFDRTASSTFLFKDLSSSSRDFICRRSWLTKSWRCANLCVASSPAKALVRRDLFSSCSSWAFLTASLALLSLSAVLTESAAPRRSRSFSPLSFSTTLFRASTTPSRSRSRLKRPPASLSPPPPPPPRPSKVLAALRAVVSSLTRRVILPLSRVACSNSNLSSMASPSLSRSLPSRSLLAFFTMASSSRRASSRR